MVIFLRKNGNTVIWCICAVIARVVSFYLLRAPILDLPYINRPASMNLNYVTFENDNNHEYAVFINLLVTRQIMKPRCLRSILKPTIKKKKSGKIMKRYRLA